MNFGARPFLHPVQGYQPLDLRHQQQQQQPAAASAGSQAQSQPLAAAHYLAGCLSRLLDVSSPAAELPAAAEDAAAADTGGTDTPGSASGDEAATAEQAVASAAAAAVEVGLPGAHLLPVAAPRRGMGSSLLPDADMLAALAAAAGEPCSSKPAAPAAVAAFGPAGGSGVGSSPSSRGPAIGIDDRILLAAVLAEHLGPLCFDAYTVEAVLLPLLDDVAGELGGGCSSGSSSSGRGGGAGMDGTATGTGGSSSSSSRGGDTCGQELGRQRLQQLLELLAVVLEPEELVALVATSCQVSMQPCLLHAETGASAGEGMAAAAGLRQ